MARTVEEIMNREVFALRPDEPVEQALGYILALGITGAPVTDPERHVLGHASFRDLLAREGSTVEDRMTAPPLTVRPNTAIDEAGRRMAKRRVHRLIVVDQESRVVGLVSTLDVISGLAGIPVGHPPAFPRFDRNLGITWTDEAALTRDDARTAPDAPGVFVLIEARPLQPDRVVWIEGASNVRRRLCDLVSSPQADPILARLLEHPEGVHFRAAELSNAAERRRVTEQLEASLARFGGSVFCCETEPTVARPPPHAHE
jgi:predicted transcriptional regulator